MIEVGDGEQKTGFDFTLLPLSDAEIAAAAPRPRTADSVPEARPPSAPELFPRLPRFRFAFPLPEGRTGSAVKHVVRPDFLTPEEMDRAHALWRELNGTGRFAAAVEREIIAPNLPRISAALGEEDEATVVPSALH